MKEQNKKSLHSKHKERCIPVTKLICVDGPAIPITEVGELLESFL